MKISKCLKLTMRNDNFGLVCLTSDTCGLFCIELHHLITAYFKYIKSFQELEKKKVEYNSGDCSRPKKEYYFSNV